jgi:hypothetical protein
MPGAARHQPGSGAPGAGKHESKYKAHLQEKGPEPAEVNLDSLSAHQIRTLLDQRGINHKDCKSKPDLLQRAMFHGVGSA